MATNSLVQNLTLANLKKYRIIWTFVFLLIFMHYAAIYGLYIFVTRPKWGTLLYAAVVNEASLIGVAVGAHRLWSHRAYKAKIPLRIFLAFFQTTTLQFDIYSWCRDHRLHHQFSDTDADPYNASRGFFFAHIGWLMVRKSDSVLSKGKAVDMSDLEADPVVMFQKKYYWLLAPWIALVLPAIIPWYFWNEDLMEAWYCVVGVKLALGLHLVSLVNSAAHLWGTKPYDKHIYPVDNKIVNCLTSGEGFHNYHHVFPWDYKAAELGRYYGTRNTLYIDFFAKMGWAYDLRSAFPEMVEKRARRTGDGSRNKEISADGLSQQHSCDF